NTDALTAEPGTHLGRQAGGGRDYALRYEGAIAAKWVIAAQAARHKESNSVGPATSAGNGIEYRDASNDFFQTGGFGLIQDKNFDRKHYGASAMRLFSGHEIKGGIEYETEKAQAVKRMQGGHEVGVCANEESQSNP